MGVKKVLCKNKYSYVISHLSNSKYFYDAKWKEPAFFLWLIFIVFLKIYSWSTFLGSFPVPHKISVAVKIYNRSPQEVDTGESEAQAHLQLHKKFKVSLGYETL